MTRWRQVQKGIIDRALDDTTPVRKADIASGNLYGTTYTVDKLAPSKGVLVVSGFSGNRYAFEPLCQRLARCGYYCLSIDLPGHYMNPQRLELGKASELVLEGTLFLQKQGMKRIAVIGHSMGATASLFASAGYTSAVEQKFYKAFEVIAALVAHEAELLAAKAKLQEIAAIHTHFKQEYEALKTLMMDCIKSITLSSPVICYVFLAPPKRCRTAVPGISLLRFFSDKAIAKIVRAAFHAPATKQAESEGYAWSRPDTPGALDMQFFRAPNVREFMEYFLAMKEPVDYLQALDALAEFKSKDAAINLFGYYKKKILDIPKLFIYGTWDFQLGTLYNPFTSARLEKFYASCGNAEIIKSDMSHMMLEGSRSPGGFITMTNKEATYNVIVFLQENL